MESSIHKLKTAVGGSMERAREKLVHGLDSLIFRVDTTHCLVDSPKFDYQPIPWKGINHAPTRGEATKQRWIAIKNSFPSGASSMKDIGCCVGYFCISAAQEFGVHSFGFDLNPKFLRIAARSVPKKSDGRCHFLRLLVDENTVGLLPKTDVTLLLSVWHHWVFHYGLDVATKMLQEVWSLTGKALYFESGEKETIEEFKLPFSADEDVKAWLKNYLETSLLGSKVENLGDFDAGTYGHYELKDIKRSLFKISHV